MPNFFRHVNDPSFGLDSSKFEKLINTVRDNLASEDDGQPKDFLAMHVMTKTAFEMGYGLHPHDVTKRPFALMAANGKEDYQPYSNQYRDYCRFVELDVQAKTGESMSEFFRRPRHECEMIFSIVQRARKGDAQMADGVAQALKNIPQAVAKKQ